MIFGVFVGLLFLNMKYEIYWDKYKIIQTEKVNKIYISILNKRNFLLATNNGMPS